MAAAGREPTVTDANLVLGRLPPRLLGGAMELDAGRACRARGLGDALGLDPAAAAAGVIDIVTDNMLGRAAGGDRRTGLTIRATSRWCRSAAPAALHANALARAARLLPGARAAGVRRAFRARVVASEVRNESSARRSSATRPLVRRSGGDLCAARPRWPGRADEWLSGERVPPARPLRRSYVVDMRYAGQSTSCRSTADGRTSSEPVVEALQASASTSAAPPAVRPQ